MPKQDSAEYKVFELLQEHSDTLLTVNLTFRRVFVLVTKDYTKLPSGSRIRRLMPSDDAAKRQAVHGKLSDALGRLDEKLNT